MKTKLCKSLWAKVLSQTKFVIFLINRPILCYLVCIFMIEAINNNKDNQKKEHFISSWADILGFYLDSLTDGTRIGNPLRSPSPDPKRHTYDF